MSQRHPTFIPVAMFLLLYLAAGLGAPYVHSHFWTSSASFDSPPWYFIGEAMVAGCLYGAVYLIFIFLLSWSRDQYRSEFWWLCMLATMWLGVPIIRAIMILVQCHHVFDPVRATTEFENHAGLVSGTLTWFPLTLSTVVGLVIGIVLKRRDELSER